MTEKAQFVFELEENPISICRPTMARSVPGKNTLNRYRNNNPNLNRDLSGQVNTGPNTHSGNSKKTGISLPWFVPGVSFHTKKSDKLTFTVWDWANTRDSMYLFSLPYCNVISTRGIAISDNRYTMMQVSKSMWNIQGYANEEKWDSVAMEGRIILESVCSYINKYRTVQLNQAVNEAISSTPNIETELNYLKHIGCMGVHFQDNMDSLTIFRTTEKSAFNLIQAVYNLIKKMEKIIYDDYENDWVNALKKLTVLRNKLSPERLNCRSNDQIRTKSCADEAKPKGCKKKKHLGCPYLHKGDCGFNLEDAKKHLEMLRSYKNNLRESGKLTDENEDYGSDNSIKESEYDNLTEKFTIQEEKTDNSVTNESEKKNESMTLKKLDELSKSIANYDNKSEVVKTLKFEAILNQVKSEYRPVNIQYVYDSSQGKIIENKDFVDTTQKNSPKTLNLSELPCSLEFDELSRVSDMSDSSGLPSEEEDDMIETHTNFKLDQTCKEFLEKYSIHITALTVQSPLSLPSPLTLPCPSPLPI